MSEGGVELSVAVSTAPHTRALKEGAVAPQGLRLNFVEVVPMVAAYRRMIRDLEFDVCGLAPVTYLAAREAGLPITALPIFLARRFHHGDIVCRPGSGIRTPEDLEGRRIGVRAYTVSTGVWLRGILESEYGVDLDSITWVVDDEEHVSSFALPSNVEKTAPGDSIADQFANGKIDAGLTGPAGIGRKGAAKEGWSVSGASFEDARAASDRFYPLFPDAESVETDWYRRTHIYPIHALLAVKSSVVAAHPEVAASLLDAFVQAKGVFLTELASGSASTAKGREYSALQAIVGPDPLPYGIEENRASLEALCDFAVSQHIVQRRPTVDELFVNT
ncbi:ABC transporter substrate-binding protein [Phytohabitans sp. ZYX-F-186]|uniref:ABC transporter substrate-binding protein n=1 Tax=Phytohabitans maris TaxID=3071409 RepID=A0ABU0ZMD2_9ACTN|nr:PhnD/SsuA/transferrin family substrate-binding protein [Phytohabitans sp. ZYX-F-186]MDQ7907554.1 ABC transporter substrate-binding protein [Phytohabitans sp. ZYX-F-186]